MQIYKDTTMTIVFHKTSRALCLVGGPTWRDEECSSEILAGEYLYLGADVEQAAGAWGHTPES